MTPKLDILPVLPEIILAVFGMLALLLAAARDRVTEKSLAFVALAGIALAAAATLSLWNWSGDASVLGGMVSADRLSVVSRLVLLGIAAFGVAFGEHYFRRLGEQRREFTALLLFATTGMTLITAANDLIVVFLALEILSLSLYVLVGFSSRAVAGEASLKYFLLGAFSSAFFLYGIAMAYGATGTTNIGKIALALGGPGNQAIGLLAVVFLLVGFCFKVAAVPFHMWTPDVYQGAATPVTAFMSAATKVAAFIALIRVFDVAFQSMAWNWTPIVVWVAGITIVVGSLLAIAQSDVKRMLAYSSIAHAGFVLTGLTAANQKGIQAATFYLIVYALMTLGSFGVVMLVAYRGEERTDLDAYQGLGRRSPVLAGLMTVFMLSLAGIPPMAGFLAKVGVFQAAASAGYWPLVLVGVLASVVAAFFYLRIIVLMYMADQAQELETDSSRLTTALLAALALAIVVLGIVPGIILPFLQKAAILNW